MTSQESIKMPRRAPLQVIVFPYRKRPDGLFEYAVFRRDAKTGGYWQAVAGGGDEGESPLEAAKRETHEEAGIPQSQAYIELQSVASVPIYHFKGRDHWPKNLYVIPEYAFGVEAAGVMIHLSHEHQEVLWIKFEEALDKLHWDSNKTALWELNKRLKRV